MKKLEENIFLIGFMGAGKSTVAAELERQLHIPRAEMDALIVEREGDGNLRYFCGKRGDIFP